MIVLFDEDGVFIHGVSYRWVRYLGWETERLIMLLEGLVQAKAILDHGIVGVLVQALRRQGSDIDVLSQQPQQRLQVLDLLLHSTAGHRAI